MVTSQLARNGRSGLCLVTGATGFIGSHTLDWLAATGWKVRALKRQSNASQSALGVEWVIADLSNVDELERAMQDVDVVIHLAGVGSPSWGVERSQVMFEATVVGTLNLAEAARRHGIKRIVSASSASIYGNVDSKAIAETTLPAPTTLYGLSKLSQEDALKMVTRTSGIETVSLRLFNVYGPGEDMGENNRKLIPNIVRNVRAGTPITVFGDGQQTRDFVYVDNVAEAISKCTSMSIDKFEEINIGTGKGTTILSVIDEIATNLGAEPKIQYEPERPGEVRHSVADCRRALDLGIENTVCLSEGIRASLLPYGFNEIGSKDD